MSTAASIPFWDRPPPGLSDYFKNLLKYGEGPTYLENEWDYLFINDDPTPGKCEVGGGVKLQIDKKKPAGSDGIYLTGTGLLPGPVDIDITLYTQAQWTEFLKLVPKIWVTPSRGAEIKAVNISHPAFDLWGVTQVIVENPSVPKRGPIPQTIVVSFRCFQFLPPSKKNRTSTPMAPTPVTEDQRTSTAELDPATTDTGPLD